MVGYIKLHRQITQWEWYTDVNTKTLFLHCLIMANHKNNQWRGVEIKTGSFASSLRKLSVETGLTVSQIRTSLSKLEITQDIAQDTHTHFTLIKVLNYAKYQSSEKEQIAQDTHETSHPSRTQNSTQNSNKQEYKENKNEKKLKNKDNKDIYFASELLNQTFNDFIIMRKSIKSPMTDRAIKLMINKIEKYDEQVAIQMLEQSIVNNWKSIYELKETTPEKITEEKKIKGITYL